MRALVRVYGAFLKIALADMFQYRAAMFIWMIGRIVEPVIYLVVWSTVAQAQGGQVAGYSGADFAAYYLVLMVVNQVTFTWIMFEYEHRIRHGSLSFLLLRPLHPIHEDLAANVAYKILTLVVLVPATAALWLAFPSAWHLEAWQAALFVPALGLAFGLRFVLEWTLAQAAFWTTRVAALNQLYFFVLLFLSGRMAPLALFPPALRSLALGLPFYWMLAFPAELLVGRLTWEEAWQGLGVQAAYLALSLALLGVVWRAGVRRYSAVGG